MEWGTRNGKIEPGMVNKEWERGMGMGNEECGTGNAEQGMGNRECGTGNAERGMGTRNK